MQVAPSLTTLTVGLTPEEVAQEQVKHETQQRVIEVNPYFVAHDNSAAPLSAKQKLRPSFKALIDQALSQPWGLPQESNKT
jgi:hypothetical protein